MAEARNLISIPSFVFKRLVRLNSKEKNSYGDMINILIDHYEEKE